MKQSPRNGHASGLEAEREVGELLTKLLLDGYLVLNDIKFKYGNIDHIVIRLRQGKSCVLYVPTDQRWVCPESYRLLAAESPVVVTVRRLRRCPESCDDTTNRSSAWQHAPASFDVHRPDEA